MQQAFLKIFSAACSRRRWTLLAQSIRRSARSSSNRSSSMRTPPSPSSLSAPSSSLTRVMILGDEISARSISRTCPEAIHFYYHCKKRKGENKTLCSFRFSLPACSPACIKSSFSSSMQGQWKSFFPEGPPEVQKNKPDFTFMSTFQPFLSPCFKKEKRATFDAHPIAWQK